MMKTRLPSTMAGELAGGLEGVLAAGLGEQVVEACAPGAGVLGPRQEGLRGGPDVGLGDVRVPHVDEAHAGVAGHPLAVHGHGGHRRRPVLGGREAVGAAGDDDARGEPLDVPLPGRRQRLVEVVGVEHERPLGRPEEPEVGQVGVAAGLHDDVGAGRDREVEGHHRGRAAVVGEGRLGHARVAQRHEVGQAVLLLLLEDGDGVAAGPRLEGGVAGPGHALARRAALVDACRREDPRSCRPDVARRWLGRPGLGDGRWWGLLARHDLGLLGRATPGRSGYPGDDPGRPSARAQAPCGPAAAAGASAARRLGCRCRDRLECLVAHLVDLGGTTELRELGGDGRILAGSREDTHGCLAAAELRDDARPVLGREAQALVMEVADEATTDDPDEQRWAGR